MNSCRRWVMRHTTSVFGVPDGLSCELTSADAMTVVRRDPAHLPHLVPVRRRVSFMDWFTEQASNVRLRRPSARRLLYWRVRATPSRGVHPLAVGHPPGSGLGLAGEGGAPYCLTDLHP